MVTDKGDGTFDPPCPQGSNDTTHHKRGLSSLNAGLNTYYYLEGSKNADGSGHYCNFKCPDDKPFIDEQGYYQPCNFSAAIPDKEGKTLKACPKKRYINGKYSYSCATADKGENGLGNNYIQCAQCGGKLIDFKCVF